MNKQQPTWLGLNVENCLIEELIGEGSYSWIYKGRKLDGTEFKAFKCAKPSEFVERMTSAADTQAKGFFTGGARDIKPDAHFLLVSQARKLQAVDDAELVKADRLCAEEGLAYFQMEYIDGQPLSKIEHLLKLCTAMQRLGKQEKFQHHGDLKPANVLVTADSGIMLIDPGYFGPIDSAEGQFTRAAVTTPFYYPYLVPDDLLAVGIMAWEVLLGINPFAGNFTLPSTIARSAQLKHHVKVHNVVGNFNLDPLLSLPLPTELHSSFSQKRESSLLKAIKLQRTADNQLDQDPGFSSFEELRYNLERVHD